MPSFGLLALNELSELVSLDDFYLGASRGSDGLWHVSETCALASPVRDRYCVSELAAKPLCECHREDPSVIRMLREFAPLPDLLARPVFHSAAEASTWAGLFLAVLKSSDRISESAFQKAVELVRKLVPPAPLAPSGTLVMVERGSHAGMVPHMFRVALQNALVHDPRGASLVLVPRELPAVLFENTSLAPSVFHLVAHHLSTSTAQRCAHLTMRLYDNGSSGLTPSEAFRAADVLIKDATSCL